MKGKIYNSNLSPYQTKKKKSSENLPHFRNQENKDYSDRYFKKQPRNYSRPVHFVSDQLEKNQTQGSEQYQVKRHRNTAPLGFPKQKRSFGVQRINQLKDMVDNIISDCKIQSKQVKHGLQQIKQYQLDVLRQLQDDYDSGQEQIKSSGSERNQRVLKQSNNYPRNENKIMEQVMILRQQKLNLMKELNQQIRKNNQLSREIKKLENTNNKLRKELQRSAIKPSKLDQTENYENQSIINKLRGQDRPLHKLQKQNIKLKQEITRLNDFKKNSEDQEQIDSLKKQVTQLTEELNAAEEEIKRLNRKLAKQSSNNDKQQIKRLNQIIQMLEDKVSQLEERLRKNGDLVRQFAKLKQQNEELRIQTIRLLKKKESSSHNNSQNNQDVQMLQDQIMRLHDNIEKENFAKKKFLEDMNNYKRQFNDFERQNRMLKENVEQLQSEIKRLKSSSSNYYGSINPVTYDSKQYGKNQLSDPKYYQRQLYTFSNVQQGKPTSTYDQMANVLLDEGTANNYESAKYQPSQNYDSNLEKYRSVLDNLRNARSGRPS